MEANEAMKAMAEHIADALGCSFDEAHVNKRHWIETGGMLNGKFRDVNDLRQDDFLAAAAAVRSFMGSDEAVERVADAICSARCDAGRPDPGKGLDEFIARAALSAAIGEDIGGGRG